MNIDNIHDAIGLLDDDIIEAVDELRNKRGKGQQRKRMILGLHYVAIAACLCVVVLCAYTAVKPQMKKKGNYEVQISNENEGVADMSEGSDDIMVADKKSEENSLKREEETISIKITAWNGNSFTGSVTKHVNTEAYAVGSEVIVKCSEDINSTDFPVGSIVIVSFSLTENAASTDAGNVLYAKSIVLTNAD